MQNVKTDTIKPKYGLIDQILINRTERKAFEEQLISMELKLDLFLISVEYIRSIQCRMFRIDINVKANWTPKAIIHNFTHSI